MILKLTQTRDECYIVNKQIFKSNTSQLQPSDCTSIAIDCCYVYINYKLGITPMENTYCTTLRTSKEKFQKQVYDMYSDEVKWYANDTYFNYDRYSTIGSNLNYNYYSNYKCFNPPKPEDFSTYPKSICAKFSPDGKDCLITNDQDKFDKFVENLYEELIIGYCDNAETPCLNPYNEKTQKNDMLMPLFEELRKSLKVGNDTHSKKIYDTDVNDNNNYN